MNELSEIEIAKKHLKLCEKRRVYDESTHIIGCCLTLLEEKEKALNIAVQSLSSIEILSTSERSRFHARTALKKMAFLGIFTLKK
ncbi:hypothetical protein M2444_006160 [Paenibacillus sp. PastF-3]|uniref:hypothetical protein n=1 Tax=unclassified Paenibacillus TaxID=185978 RepID=UPI002473AA50|nr:hypothetical protein [Paenibacillus sp. PastF-3]MDH6374310.1 hypothetical protein [Paenibacillus sp. PastF-3]